MVMKDKVQHKKCMQKLTCFINPSDWDWDWYHAATTSSITIDKMMWIMYLHILLKQVIITWRTNKCYRSNVLNVSYP